MTGLLSYLTDITGSFGVESATAELRLWFPFRQWALERHCCLFLEQHFKAQALDQ